MEIELFNYHLPEDQLALFPASRRDGSRLMALDRRSGEISLQKFSDIKEYFRAGDALVVNNTRVFKARLFSRRATGGKVEVFLLEEVKYDNKVCWEVLTHPTRRVREGEPLFIDEDNSFKVLRKLPNGRTIIHFSSRAEASRLISKFGHVPLPVYIHRPDQNSDEKRYQTVYAQKSKDKSVAAPTAGLHFTNRILSSLKEMGVKIIPITLHVGYGTFKPVKAANIEDHTVDPEFAEISKSSAKAINRVRQKGGRIFAVGTTSVRTLESAEMVKGEIQPLNRPVDLYIRPGFKFRVVDHMITNFHLPRSSLIILVSAFAGRENILRAYQTAVENKYRFYSYGDCMLIL